MCKCFNVPFGSYERQVQMKDPFNSRKKHDGWVCIDICICQEIAELWHRGIKTYESCCGHNKDRGYIMVTTDDFQKMKEIEGYEEDESWNRKNRDSKLRVFYPKLK